MTGCDGHSGKLPVEEEVDMDLELHIADTDMAGLLVEEAAERMAPH